MAEMDRVVGAMQQQLTHIEKTLREHGRQLGEIRDLLRDQMLIGRKEYTAPPKLQLSWPKIATVVAKQAVSVAIMASMIRNDADLSTILQQAYGLL